LARIGGFLAMSNLIEIIPDFEIHLGQQIDPDLFNQVKQLEKYRDIFLKQEISFEDYLDAIACAVDVDDYLDEVDNRLDLWL
jgi:hypothetical protein